MSGKNYRKLLEWHDSRSGFLNNQGHFLSTSPAGFSKKAKENSLYAMALDSVFSQWIGKSNVVLTDANVYLKGKCYATNSLSDSIALAFTKQGFLIVIYQSGTPSYYYGIKIFKISDLVETIYYNDRVINTPIYSNDDAFNGMWIVGVGVEIVINKAATKLCMIGENADTSPDVAVFYYSIGDISASLDWLTLTSSSKSDASTKSHVYYEDDDETEQFMRYEKTVTAQIPIPGTFLPGTFPQAFISLFERTVFFRGMEIKTYVREKSGSNDLCIERKEALFLGINKYVDDVNVVYRTRTEDYGIDEYAVRSGTVTNTYSTESKRGIIPLTLPPDSSEYYPNNFPIDPPYFAFGEFIIYPDRHGNLLYFVDNARYFSRMYGAARQKATIGVKKDFLPVSTEVQNEINLQFHFDSMSPPYMPPVLGIL